MGRDAHKQLNQMVSTGPVEYVFEAEQSLSLIEACGKNQAFLVKGNFGELFGTIQGLAINQFVLSVTKLYEKPTQRYPNRSIPSVLKFIEDNAKLLEVRRPKLVQRGLQRLKIDTSEFDKTDSSLQRNLLIVRNLKAWFPDVDSDDALRALKALRDKKFTHPEDIDIDKIEKTTWEQAERLLVLPRAIIGIIGDAYLSMAYWDDKGDYLLSIDGSRVGRAMDRLIKTASK